jgi:hypothetical protein
MICKQGSWSVPSFEVVYAFAGRMKVLQPGKSGNKNGPVVYWMSRDHRSRDNWALLHAVSQARMKGVPVAVVFNLVDKFLDAKARHFGFMLRGLQVVEQNLKAVGIPFFIFRVTHSFYSFLFCTFAHHQSLCRRTSKAIGIPFFLFWLQTLLIFFLCTLHVINPCIDQLQRQYVWDILQIVCVGLLAFQGKAEDTVPSFIERCNASLLVMDYSSLRIGRQWRKAVCQKVDSVVEVMEVDAHNVVPIWCASDKLEYGARTIRTKIQRQLSEFLTEYPILESSGKAWDSEPPPCIQWDSLIADVLRYVSSTQLYILHCVRKKECLQFGQNQEMRG